jgi:Protein of unknown function (DUF2752)
MQRALKALFELDFFAAFNYNAAVFPFVFLLFIMLLFLLSKAKIKYVNGKTILLSFYCFIFTLLLQYVAKFI